MDYDEWYKTEHTLPYFSLYLFTYVRLCVPWVRECVRMPGAWGGGQVRSDQVRLLLGAYDSDLGVLTWSESYRLIYIYTSCLYPILPLVWFQWTFCTISLCWLISAFSLAHSLSPLIQTFHPFCQSYVFFKPFIVPRLTLSLGFSVLCVCTIFILVYLFICPRLVQSLG